MEYVMISIGGILGANARYLLASWAANKFPAAFPYGTFIINTSGAFVLGFFLAFCRDRAFIGANYRLFFATGFCGAYTTFSTLAFESLRLIQDGAPVQGLTNLLGNLAIGMLAVVLGSMLGSMI
jgi:CrcB protein